MNKTADSGKPSEDWDRFDAMSAAARRTAANADPDAKPLAFRGFQAHAAGRSKSSAARSASRKRSFRRGSIFQSAHCVIGSRGAKSQTPPPALISK